LQGLKESGVDYNLLDDQANSQGDPLGLASGMLTAYPEANIFWASNEGSTIATAQAVAAEGKIGKVTVFGYDSSDQTSAMILDDKTALEAVVTQAPYMMGYGAVTLICDHLINGKDISGTKGTTETCPGEVLSKGNPDGVKKWRSDNGLN
jgi:ABC-type sugar transport system substrate-binding protein